MHVRQDQRKRNTKEERDTAAGKPGRLRPKTQASKKRAHPNTDPRESARRNRGKYPEPGKISGNARYPETRNRLKKSLPHRQSHSTHQPPGLSPDELPAYLFIKRKMVKEEENGTCIL